MSAHSPGPWRWEDGKIVDVNGHPPIFVDSSAAWEAGDEVVGYCVPQDARLIAAAPEMLELLRDAGQWYCGELPDGTDRRSAIAALLARIDG